MICKYIQPLDMQMSISRKFTCSFMDLDVFYKRCLRISYGTLRHFYLPFIKRNQNWRNFLLSVAQIQILREFFIKQGPVLCGASVVINLSYLQKQYL